MKIKLSIHLLLTVTILFCLSGCVIMSEESDGEKTTRFRPIKKGDNGEATYTVKGERYYIVKDLDSLEILSYSQVRNMEATVFLEDQTIGDYVSISEKERNKILDERKQEEEIRKQQEEKNRKDREDELKRAEEKIRKDREDQLKKNNEFLAKQERNQAALKELREFISKQDKEDGEKISIEFFVNKKNYEKENGDNSYYNSDQIIKDIAEIMNRYNN